jgi:hypothetical protein
MTCPHAETTTVAWLYGEGDEGHAAHVASCPDCEAVSALHAEVVCLTSPVLPALRSGEVPVAAPASPSWARPLLLLAAAATLVVVPLVRWQSPPEPPPTTPALATRALPDEPELLDLRLERLEDQVLDLSLDLEAL